MNPSIQLRGDSFFNHNSNYMLYFLVKKGNELQVMPILPAEEETFRLLYFEFILVEGKSYGDVLTQFYSMPVVLDKEAC